MNTSRYLILLTGIICINCNVFCQNSSSKYTTVKYTTINYDDPQAGQLFIANNIYFPQNRVEIREESFPYLDTIAYLLELIPNCIIEIGVHSNAIPEEYSSNPGAGRAVAIQEYLTAKHQVDPLRIIAKGYSDSEPMHLTSDIKLSNGELLKKGTILTEELISKYKDMQDDHDLLLSFNRRVEFKITGFTVPYLHFKQFMRFCTVDFANPQIGQYWIDNILSIYNWDLRNDVLMNIDSLKFLLDKYPALVFEINFNTDSRDADGDNLIRSERKAKSVKEYLVSIGVDSSRIISKGFGESNPRIMEYDLTLPSGNILLKGTKLTEDLIKSYKDKSDVELLHQLNRRTTFTIVAIK